VPSNKITVKISGFTELRRALRQIDTNADKTLGEAIFGIAKGIAVRISGAMPKLSGAAAGTVQPHLKLRGASISIGTGRSDDYVPWLDFGGAVGRQASIHRLFIKEGRYLYPQITAARSVTLKAIEDAIVIAAERAGFTVT